MFLAKRGTPHARVGKLTENPAWFLISSGH